MISLLVHVIGFFTVNALIPAWAVEVDGELASTWYLSFMLVDMIALSFVKVRWLKAVLAISCAWSACLALETLLLHDMLQSHDYIAQLMIDAALIICAARIAFDYYRAHKAPRMVA
ncbi:hypothetical protein H7A76_30260 [Pseudomonas sp. MSSRFD41]|uniref:hypothetical protein n=1 Tax=Pseudomonas sp. MSSRFD41 TaxID=1310370 RepID=UPI0016396CB1|nr:hypothetical protein [Pseudomonas sp. MSSRFD41]MBC2659738.1 hypothetical protein [Pseudomonas sp. MSSRFD41]